MDKASSCWLATKAANVVVAGAVAVGDEGTPQA